MSDAVGRVALVEEALPQLCVSGELGVEQLQRHALAVAMRGCINRGHAPDAEQRVEVPAVADGLPDPRHGDARLLILDGRYDLRMDELRHIPHGRIDEKCWRRLRT